MDWTAQIDSYCERTSPAYWAEPINAVTNLAFIIAALVMWQRTTGNRTAQVLCAILFCIGVGSYLFHTHATAWAALADTAPIGVFILVYLFAVNRSVVGWPLWGALLGTIAFFPYAAVVTMTLNRVPFLSISNFYWTVPILLVIYGAALRHRAPATARGFLAGAGLLSVSITARSLDEILCPALPIGTHFLWHCLNGVMLGYMIHVYHAHVLAGRRRAG